MWYVPNEYFKFSLFITILYTRLMGIPISSFLTFIFKLQGEACRGFNVGNYNIPLLNIIIQSRCHFGIYLCPLSVSFCMLQSRFFLICFCHSVYFDGIFCLGNWLHLNKAEAFFMSQGIDGSCYSWTVITSLINQLSPTNSL